MNPLISVVIPIYNVEIYLKQCIESVIRQSYNELEIILIDDGSTDNCLAICNRYALEDNRIKVIHKQNGGLSDARNIGISVSTGEYITFIDSDDYIECDMIKYLFDLLQKTNADLSVCQKLNVRENGNIIKEKINVREYVLENNYECMKNFLSEKYINTVAWGKLYKKDLFFSIRYPYGKYHEDVYTMYKVIALCNRICVGSQQKYFYRIRSGSITSSTFSIKHLDAIEGKIQQKDFLQKNYPKLIKFGYSGIIYAINQCIFKMPINFEYSEAGSEIDISEWTKYYRHYSIYYLTGKSSIKGKIFTIISCINIKISIGLLKIYQKAKK